MQTESSGIYIAIKYNPYSAIKLKDIAENYGVPNIIPIDKFHTTLIYSTKGADNVEIYENMQYIALPDKLDIWTSQSGEKCLVLKINCKQLVDRNKELMDKYQFVSDYPEYTPHITLSYDIGEWNRIDEMQTHINNNKIYNALVSLGEYSEELEKEWASTI